MDNDHQGSEDVDADGDKALPTLDAVIFHGERKRVAKHAITLSERHAMLLDVCRILLRIELGGHAASICTLCIHVNVGAPHGVEH